MTEQNPLVEEAAKTVADVREAATVMFEKLQELASDHGEQAIELALAVARVDAMSWLVTPIILMMMSVFLWRFWNRYPLVNYNNMRARVDKKREERPNYRTDGDEDGVALLFWVSSTIITIFTLTGVIIFGSRFWAVVGTFYPELWLAKKAMEHVL